MKAEWTNKDSLSIESTGQEINYLKGEIKSMHRMGLLVPSSTYERLHRLEKALEKMRKGESSKGETE